MSGSAGYLYKVDEVIPGTKLRVQRCLGRGGMGSVYEVSAPPRGERYVVKVVHPHLLKATRIRERLRKEAILLTEFEHPNIVQVVFTGETADDPPLPYYAMERLYGCALSDALLPLAGRGLPLSTIFEITAELLSALSYAHDRGVVHRDVKLDNVFLHYEPSGARVTKLLDFGIVRVLSEARATMAGFVGTLGNAAPEQLRNEDPTPACDIYSVGVTLYQMVTGCDPFGDLADPQAIMRAHLFARPVPASTHRFIPQQLDALLLAMMEKEPHNRPSSRDIRSAIQRLADAVAADASFQVPESSAIWADTEAQLRREAAAASALAAATCAAPARISNAPVADPLPPTLSDAFVERTPRAASTASGGARAGRAVAGSGRWAPDDGDCGPAGTVRLAAVSTTSAKTSFSVHPPTKTASASESFPESARETFRHRGLVLGASATVAAILVFGVWWLIHEQGAGSMPASSSPTLETSANLVPFQTPGVVPSSGLAANPGASPDGTSVGAFPSGTPAVTTGTNAAAATMASSSKPGGIAPAGGEVAAKSRAGTARPGPGRPTGGKRPQPIAGEPKEKEGTGALVAPDWGSIAPASGKLGP